MDGKYPVFRDGESVGESEIKRSGLYYHFSCRCTLQEGERIHLKVSCDNHVTDLGLCVPMDGCFGVETSVPVKKIGIGTPEFFLGNRKLQVKLQQQENDTTSEEQATRLSVPVDPDQPFEHLTELNGAVLNDFEGEKVIQLQHPDQDQQGSDQSPLSDSE